MKISKLSEGVLWTNPKPVLRSRHSFFPYAIDLGNGTLLASHVIGEAFESVDQTTRMSKSSDGGKTWELLPEMYDKSIYGVPVSDYLKVTDTGGGRLILFGYEFIRNDPEKEIGNPVTGGLLESRIILIRSSDGGKSWGPAEEIPCRWGGHAEASAPITVLKNGSWISPITEFAKWDGSISGPLCGRMLRSDDCGRTWNDDAVTIALGEHVTAFEQRACQLEHSGRVVVIAWNEDLKTGERYNNHYAVSCDDAKTFDGPFDTGVRGQASSVCAIGGDYLLALHAVRRDTERPGVYAYVVNLKNGAWDIEDECIVWEPNFPMVKDENKAEVFAFLKFGQPGAVKLADGHILTTHWAIINGQGMIVTTKLKIG